MKNLKVILMATGDFAYPIIEFLHNNTNLIMVVTQPDKTKGKKKNIIKDYAIENNIKLFTPFKIKEEYDEIIKEKPDLIITASYGQIIPKILLDLPKYGAINVHGSILPKYRGASPIQTSILNGDKETGVTLMYMDEHMDTGDIIDIKKINIENDTYGTLLTKLSILGVDLLKENLPKIINKTNNKVKQNESVATYTHIFKREDEELNFNQKGIDIINKINAFNPNPYANIKINNIEYKIVKAKFLEKETNSVGIISEIEKDKLGISARDGIIYIERIIPSGKKEMDIKSFLNGVNKEKLKGVKVNEKEN